MGRAGYIHVVRWAAAALLGCAVLGVPARPAIADPSGSPCKNNNVSALNQYCENVASANGPGTPGVGTPALAPTLPARIQRSLSPSAASHLSPQTRARLRMLPAPVRTQRVSASIASTTPLSTAHPITQWLTFILVLVAIALALVVLAIGRRRRGA